MMLKLYAVNIVAGRYAWKKLPFSKKIKDLIKEQIRLMVEDEAVVTELTKED
ncbi:CD1375 family protein [Streptococcus merionis]|uniref:CD1375 family protein n=1 Tax=Streptococcus merionis TaxID=400065 RepID=UPI003517EA8C